MELAISRIAKILIAALMMLALGMQSAIASDVSSKIKISEISNSDTVRIQPSIVDGQKVDIVKVGNLPDVVVRAESETSDFTNSEKEQLSEIRRDILDKTLTGLIAGATEQPMLVNDSSVIKVDGSSKSANASDDLLASFTSVDSSKQKTVREKARAFVAFLNEAILRSTYRAGQAFVQDTKKTKGFK